jgi:small subunit ribosomal protein S16
MVVLRLARHGAKKRPFYHIVAADSRSKRDGKNLERIGFFNPMATDKEQKLCINLTRTNHWIEQGAQVSHRVKSLIKDFQATQVS